MPTTEPSGGTTTPSGGSEPRQPDRPLTVLLTNFKLSGRSGTETLTRNIALELRRQGHRPLVYSPIHGPIVEELRGASIPVTDDIGSITVKPDIIHGHHLPACTTAAIRFRDRPAIFFCHDFQQWHDRPPSLPNLRHFLAHGPAVMDRLTVEGGVPEQAVRIMPNPVDLRRFQPGPPLPARARRVALFAKGRGYLPVIREACAKLGLELEVFGSPVDRLVAEPEAVMPEFDIIVGTGLTALESIATGRAALVCDPRGLAGLCTLERFPHYRRNNFGLRLLDKPLNATTIATELAAYDAADAAAISAALRAEAGLDRYVERLVAFYREVMRDFAQAAVDEDAWPLAIARHLQAWGPRPDNAWPWMQEREALMDRVAELETGAAALRADEHYGFYASEPRRWCRRVAGFANAERSGTWTVGDETSFTFAIPPGLAGTQRLEFRLRPLLHPAGPERDVDVIVNGRLVAEWRFRGVESSERRETVDLPPGTIGPAGQIWVLLRIINPQSPRELSGSADGRRLGVTLISLAWRPGQEADGAG